MVRAKFKVTQTSQKYSGTEPTHVITLHPVTNGSTENEQFYRYTPGGSIELTIVTDKTAKQLELGKEYYVDFTLAE